LERENVKREYTHSSQIISVTVLINLAILKTLSYRIEKVKETKKIKDGAMDIEQTA